MRSSDPQLEIKVTGVHGIPLVFIGFVINNHACFPAPCGETIIRYDSSRRNSSNSLDFWGL